MNKKLTEMGRVFSPLAPSILMVLLK